MLWITMNKDDKQSKTMHITCASSSRGENNKRGSSDINQHVEHKSKKLKRCASNNAMMTSRTHTIVDSGKSDTNNQFESLINNSKKSSKKKHLHHHDKKRNVSDLLKTGVLESTSETLLRGTKRICSVVAEICGSCSYKEVQSTVDRNAIGNTETSLKHCGHRRDRNRKKLISVDSSVSHHKMLLDQPGIRLDKTLKCQQGLTSELTWSQIVRGQPGGAVVTLDPEEKYFKMNKANTSFDTSAGIASQRILSKHENGKTVTTCVFVDNKGLVQKKTETVNPENSREMFVTSELSELEDGEIIDKDECTSIYGQDHRELKHRSSKKLEHVSCQESLSMKRLQKVERFNPQDRISKHSKNKSKEILNSHNKTDKSSKYESKEKLDLQEGIDKSSRHKRKEKLDIQEGIVESSMHKRKEKLDLQEGIYESSKHERKEKLDLQEGINKSSKHERKEKLDLQEGINKSFKCERKEKLDLQEGIDKSSKHKRKEKLDLQEGIDESSMHKRKEKLDLQGGIEKRSRHKRREKLDIQEGIQKSSRHKRKEQLDLNEGIDKRSRHKRKEQLDLQEGIDKISRYKRKDASCVSASGSSCHKVTNLSNGCSNECKDGNKSHCKIRSEIEKCEQFHLAKPEQTVNCHTSETIEKAEECVIKTPPYSPSDCVIEGEEIPSDTDNNSDRVLSPSGSDMSISSEDGSRSDGYIFVGEMKVHEAQSCSVATIQTSTANKFLTSRLNPFTPAFVPKLHLPAAEIKTCEKVNSVQISGDSMKETPKTYFGMPANENGQSQTFYQNQPAEFSYLTARCMSSILQATDTTCYPISSRMSCTKTALSQLSKDSFQRSPDSIELTTHRISQAFSDARSSSTSRLNQMYNQASMTVPLNSSSQRTCPELTDTPRCWQTLQESYAQAGNMQFTVMSYNILSQELMTRHPYLYSGCQEVDLDWTNRGAAILAQIIAHDADIVCLQEMQEDHWTHDIRDTLDGQGYHGVYKKSPGDKPDGCAILFKRSKFRQIKFIPVDFQRGGILDRNNIGIILLLEPRQDVYGGSVQKICVATTHLLFNPKRGDVKLAQLILLLAEIDKHAYVEDDFTHRKLYAATDCSSPFNEEEASTSDSSSENSQPDTSFSTEIHAPEHRYCPIILCGDFNSEPFSDLYKFITTGYLKYDQLICRFLCGQEEGQYGGSNRTVGKSLLPQSLSISETCQYVRVLKERQSRGQGTYSNQRPKVNSGQVFHGFNFRSVYSHFVGLNGQGQREISTHHNNCSCTVDYIFYSTSQVRQYQTPDGSNKAGPCQDDFLLDSHRNTTTSNHGCHQEVDQDTHSLQLLARYRLLTTKEVKKFGFTPNSILPSDHLCLIANFLLR